MTLINKACFAVVSFPYPYTLTAIHMAVCAACCHYIFYSIRRSNSNSKNHPWVQLLGEQLLQQQQQSAAPVDPHNTTRHRRDRHVLWMGALSVIFTLNIALGNVSLQHVSVNFNQVLRSLVPVVTVGLTRYALRQPISATRQRAVWPVVAGVAWACAGDRYAVSLPGMVYTLLSVVLASIKVVASTELLTGKSRKLHPVVLLQLLAPWALGQCLVLAVMTGEWALIRERWNRELDPLATGDWVPVSVLLFSGLLAFGLNISALQAYKLTSALTCCIAAAVKQVLMIVLGTIIFRTPVSPMNGMGIVVVLVASVYYSYVSIREQQQPHDAAAKTGNRKGKDEDLEDSETTVSSEGDDDDSEVSMSESRLAVVNLARERPTKESARRGVVSRWITGSPVITTTIVHEKEESAV